MCTLWAVARLDIRLADGQKEHLRARAVAEGKSLTELVTECLFGPSDGGGRTAEQLEDHERRLSRLEEVANL